MNAAVVTAYATPPTFSTFADPVPNAGETLVRVTAAGLHPIVKALANGSHYGSTGELPFVPGVDGTGVLEDGTRVYFGISRAPFGSFSEKALAASFMTIPIPEGLSDATAAGIANPAMSSWVALTSRAKFVAGESVLILGATGVAGQLAVQIAKRRGAKRVVAVGRNPTALARLQTLGADAVISLDQEHDALVEAFRTELSNDSTGGIDIVLDYLWGAPAEAALQAIAKRGLTTSSTRIRYVNIGNSAGDPVSLPAATLRSSGIELLGSGFGSASLDQIREAITDFFALAAKEPFHFEIEAAPLSDIASLWNTKEQGTRLVFLP